MLTQVEQDISRNADQLQREEQGNQIVGRASETGASDDDENARLILRVVRLRDVVPGEQDEDGSPQQGEQTNVVRQAVAQHRGSEEVREVF